jgi:probable phosphoglycerate mutase
MSFRDFTLYIVRHGETESNVAGWACGQDDAPLTANGQAHARANGRTLAEVAGDLSSLDFFASSQHRACCTMELLRETAGLSVTGYRADRRLMESNLGDHTRMPAREMIALANDSADPWNYPRPNGESYADVHARVGRFLHTLKRDSVLVSHALTSMLIRAHYLNLSPEEALRYHMPNAGLLRLSMGTEAAFGR